MFCIFLAWFLTLQGHVLYGIEELSFPQKMNYMKEYLTRDFTTFWTYKDLYATPTQIGATPQLLQKSVANLGDESRLYRLLIDGFKGQSIAMPIIGGSISRGAPFAEENLGSRIYFKAIEDWWNTMFRDISGSKLEANSISLGGIGSDYFSYCLDSHISEDLRSEFILWELAANDKGRYQNRPFPAGEPLEQLTRNIVKRKSKPAFIFLNFFRGHDASQENCPNYEDEGGLAVAIHYNITSLSWRNYICDYIRQKNSNFGVEQAFSSDKLHPSILAHAQMAFIVINYLRNAFLRVFRGPAGQAQNIDSFIGIVDQDLYALPPVLFPGTSNDTPRCFTYLRCNDYEPNNTLTAVVTRQDDFKFNIFKQFTIRTDKLGGMQTFVSEQLIQFSIYLPHFFSRLVVISHAVSGSAQLWLDHQTPVNMYTDDYHMGTLSKVISTNIQPGKHVLNVLSLKNGFVVCAIGVI